MRIAYVNYGSQSGVTQNVTQALLARGHLADHLNVNGPLELRFHQLRLPRPTPTVLLSFAAGFAQYGTQGLSDYRWNTPFAFDVHSARAEKLLRRLPAQPDVVLQNGALFSPGKAPQLPYVLLCDNTCAVAERQPAFPAAGLREHVRFGARWTARETQLYRGAAGIATFSRLVRNSLIADYGVDGRRVQVVGAGANVFPERVERKHDGNTLLFVGKDFARKGGHVLLRAFARLRRERPAARLLIAGPTTPLELSGGARCLGLVPFEGLPELFSQATAFVLPTLREPFGIAFLDAMACGVPCIGTRVGAVPETLDDGRLGLLVPPADEDALVAAMRSLLAEPARAAALGALGREKILERGLLWPEVGKRLEALLDQAVRAASAEKNRGETRAARVPPLWTTASIQAASGE